MKATTPKTETAKAIKIHLCDYHTIKNCINEEYAINDPRGAFVGDHLWMFPENWIKGLADFVRQAQERKEANGAIVANLMHDIQGYVYKERSFSPRCFKGGSVWDIKGKQPQKTIH